ncbi:MAG: LysM peptidoglycan-binding domain-containing protein [Desulfovibrionaceae bacterium]|nr:LysM peptidoglycan-binding domain-containing protein [Desulfovibrionaceae bacterium]
MSRGSLHKIAWLCSLLLLLALAGCSAKGPGVKADVVFEPEAIDKAPALSNEELACLRSTGEIDRNLPPLAMKDVTKQYKYYLRQGRKHMQASVLRSEKYLPYAKKVFGKRGMPEDLAYLAIVESGYRTDAKSHAGAVGAWQFIPGTGKNFGLHQDGWTDERMDIYEATEAAADYLRKLYTKFRDWPTAIAAYNAGEGKMQRAMQGLGAKNFFEVREHNAKLPYDLQLREETKQYVPRFIAVSKIMRNLEALNFKTKGQQEVSVTRLNAKPGTDLKALSHALHIPWGDFCKLNRHQKAPITSVKQVTYVYVPSDKAEDGANHLANQHQGQYKGWQVCTINNGGQSWHKLENYYHIPQEKLRALNPGCSLKTGELVYLPTNRVLADSGSSKSTVMSLRREAKAQGCKVKTHILQDGETLYAVARRFGTSFTELMRYNQIADPAHLPTGMVLKIPSYHNETRLAQAGTREPAQGSSQGSLGQRKASYYVVQEKDNLWAIARRKRVTVEDLKRWNHVDERNLKTGTKLTVYAD